MAKKTNSFLNTKLGLAVTAIVALGLAYLVGSRAIDTGSLLQYTLCFVLAGLAVQRTVLIFRRIK